MSVVAVRRAILLAGFALAALLPFARHAAAEEPVATSHLVVRDGPSSVSLLADVVGSDLLPRQEADLPAAATCADLGPSARRLGLELAATDADLVAESDGSRVCLFAERQWDSYRAVVLNAASAEEFRRTKALFQPLLPDAGIDPCRVAEWSLPTSGPRVALSAADIWDAGRRCAPELYAHGSESRARLADARASLEAAVVTAEQLFGWSPSWPMRVHVYDDHTAFIAGNRDEGGDPAATTRSLTNTYGVRLVLANGMTGILVDVSRFPDADGLRMLLAHEFAHVAQTAVSGGTRNLPFFAVEGGAEYFASLVVGPEQAELARRFQEAVDDEHHGAAVPLRELIRRPDDDDRRRLAASYSRGYAAMRLLAARLGVQGFARLHQLAASRSTAGFLEEMARVTGLSLDDFDAELRAHLLAQPVSAGASFPNRGALAPESRLAALAPFRRAAGGLQPADRFGRADTSVVVGIELACLTVPLPLEARVIAPDGSPFATYSGSAGPGCGARADVELPLDGALRGRTPRSLPGAWTVEIYAEGRLQGSVTFVVE
jgi:hypothetical protein